jgi:hypothetical protein
MEDSYNWDLIMKVAVPISLAVAFIFYTSISIKAQWFYLFLWLIVTGVIIYKFDKKKNNIFTAIGLVFLVALVMRFIKTAGFF